MNEWWWLRAIFYFLQNNRYWPSQAHSSTVIEPGWKASSTADLCFHDIWSMQLQEVSCPGHPQGTLHTAAPGHHHGQHGPLAGAVKGKEWQGNAFRKEKRGEETHITKVLMINESEMRGEFTYALGEEERIFRSFLHDKCGQETERKELLISGTKRFCFPPGQASTGKLLETAASSLPFTEVCSAGPTTLQWASAL